MLEVELVWPFGVGRCGRAEDETARIPDAGEESSEGGDGREAGLLLGCLDFGTGNEGRGPVGGAIEGRDGRGSVVVVIVSVSCSKLREAPGQERGRIKIGAKSARSREREGARAISMPFSLGSLPSRSYPSRAPALRQRSRLKVPLAIAGWRSSRYCAFQML
jgi:hypothetical protein